MATTGVWMASQGSKRPWENSAKMETLSRREEDALIKELKAEALKSCDDLVKEFASCVQGRTVSAAWACRTPFHAMQKCVAEFMNEDMVDHARMARLQQRKATHPAAN